MFWSIYLHATCLTTFRKDDDLATQNYQVDTAAGEGRGRAALILVPLGDL